LSKGKRGVWGRMIRPIHLGKESHERRGAAIIPFEGGRGEKLGNT